MKLFLAEFYYTGDKDFYCTRLVYATSGDDARIKAKNWWEDAIAGKGRRELFLDELDISEPLY